MKVERQFRIGSLLVATLGLLLLLAAASVNATWAAPNNQGTVPPFPTPRLSPPPPGPITTPAPGGAQSSAPGPQSGIVPPALVQIAASCVVGGGGVCLSNGLNDLIISFPRDSALLGTIVTITPLTAIPAELLAPNAVGEFLFLGHIYQIDVIGPDGGAINAFNPPLDLWIKYSSDDLTKAGGDPNHLMIMYFNTKSGNWTVEDLTNRSVDPTQNQVHVTVSHLSTFALFASVGSQKSAAPISVATPSVGTMSDDGSASWFNFIRQLLRRLTGANPGE
jgi:hypothetical protein